MPKETFVSLVIPLCSGGAGRFIGAGAAIAALASAYPDHEVLLIDDHLPPDDDLALAQLLKDHPHMRLIRLARSYGLTQAIHVGLEHAIGDFVVAFHPEQDPSSVIPEIVEHCYSNADIAQGVDENRRKRHGFGAMLSTAYYWYLRRFAGLKVPRYATHLCCLSRAALIQLKEAGHSDALFGYGEAGSTLRCTTFPYATKGPLSVKSNPALLTSVFERAGVVFEHSTHPLLVARFIGVHLAAFALIIAFLLIWSGSVSGGGFVTFALSLLFLTLLFALMLVLLLTEYMLRILTRMRQNLVTMIEGERRSPPPPDQAPRNVIVEGFGHD